ncbi:hypothetical protein [Streptomyces sp. NPDC003006]
MPGGEGRLLAPARSAAGMAAVVRNSTVTGVLSVVFAVLTFAVLTVVVVAACAHVPIKATKAFRDGGRPSPSESPHVESASAPDAEKVLH